MGIDLLDIIIETRAGYDVLVDLIEIHTKCENHVCNILEIERLHRSECFPYKMMFRNISQNIYIYFYSNGLSLDFQNDKR